MGATVAGSSATDAISVVRDRPVRAERGTEPSPDLRPRMSLDDWVDLTAGRADPRRLLLRRRLRPRGDLRLLLKLDRVFG